jgi:hypothetical protein
MAASPGDIISYIEMCQEWNNSFQPGMYFHLKPGRSVLLMSRRPNAPYRDRIEEDGKVLIYEGHDIRRFPGGPNPKTVDQPRTHLGGSLTQNGLFVQAAEAFKLGQREAELVNVYEKIHAGIWAFNGVFHLLDAWQEHDGKRNLFKLKLELVDPGFFATPTHSHELPHDRIIPSLVKLEVWKRDKGSCVKCGAKTNLHFDHDIPYSKGGSSADPKNIQLLCARHNLQKHDNIE